MIFFDISSGRDAVFAIFRLAPLRDARDALIQSTLPQAALDEEFSDALLFVLSLRLNQLTGGTPGMTFSARCHISARSAPLWPVRMSWAFLGAVIDLYCAALRGEVAHCETALYNHLRRTQRAAPPGSDRSLPCAANPP